MKKVNEIMRTIITTKTIIIKIIIIIIIIVTTIRVYRKIIWVMVEINVLQLIQWIKPLKMKAIEKGKVSKQVKKVPHHAH